MMTCIDAVLASVKVLVITTASSRYREREKKREKCTVLEKGATGVYGVLEDRKTVRCLELENCATGVYSVLEGRKSVRGRGLVVASRTFLSDDPLGLPRLQALGLVGFESRVLCEEPREARTSEQLPSCCCCLTPACVAESPRLRSIMGCFLEKFDNFLNRCFYRLGQIIANHFGYFIIIPIFITAILATGFQNIVYEDDPEYLFAPTTGGAKDERAIIEENFFLNFSSDFHPSRVTRTGRFARFIIMAKDEGTLLRTEVWNDIMELDRLTHTVGVEYDDKFVRYEDLCGIWDSKCYENNILDLKDLMPEIEAGEYNLTYPLMLNPNTFEMYVFPLFFGGLEISNSSTIESVKALSISYWLRTNTRKEDESQQSSDLATKNLSAGWPRKCQGGRA
ncbi:putative patched domain-containing protein 3 [Penaeus vannamei]|uniref:Putative patched domain-containing protein 3 n=1 Tax=Penaeus vannamei TaxID=6689 RepID=A0A423SLI4_PENVA|nr:putative patched domain-containing protein 3 [Penaeus vannamei]